MSDYDNTPGGGQLPPPGPDQRAWQGQGGPLPAPAAHPSAEQQQADAEHQRTRTRVAVTIAALVATLGAVVLGVVLANGHGSKTTSTTAGANPNAVVDPPSSGASGSASGGALPVLTGIPAAPPALNSASAMASAQAAEKVFAPPTSVPANVPGYSASAPLDAVELPPFLTVTIPSVTAKDAKAQALADQSELLLKAWAEAWATGNTDDPRYRTLCVEQCKAMLDPTVTLWHAANIQPAGTLRFFEFAGGLAKGNDQSGEVGVCLDDSALTAFRGGTTYQNPYPAGAPTLYVFGLVYDKAVGHWVATEAYSSPGDSYCNANASTS